MIISNKDGNVYKTCETNNEKVATKKIARQDKKINSSPTRHKLKKIIRR